MKILRKIPAFILLIMLLVSSVKESIFADESVFIHRPEELPSYYMNPRELATKTDEITRPIADTTEDVSIMSLMSDHSVYASKNTVVNESVLSSNLDAPDAMMTHFSLQKSARMRNTVVGMEKNSIETALQGDTLIQEKSKKTINPSAISIHEISAVNKEKAVKKIMEKMKRGKKGSLFDSGMISPFAFEFGIDGQHLIFSKPVAITINTPNMSDGIGIDIFVLHEGDTDFNTAGLTSSGDSGCNPDGTATKPGNTAIVRGGKILFYTCGASSFTMNPSGGTAGSNDLKLIIGDCAQAQIYYNGLQQIYAGDPAATGCGLPGLWTAMRIGGTTYGNGVDGVTATAWSTQSTTGSTNGNTYTATSTMTRVVGGLTYTGIIDWSHTAPNKFFNVSWRVIVPATNAANIRFYFANDSYVAGADANDAGYYTLTGGQTVGVYDNVANVLSAFRYLSGTTWTAYEAGPYATVASRITGGTDFANTYNTTGDLGFGVDWNFGTGANVTYSGTLEWRMLPYVAANVPDLVPGIGQPEGPLTTYLLSQMPITVTNAGNLASSGVHTVILTIPANITGPASSFSDNGWSCGAQVGTGVTCTKTTAIAPSLGTDTVRIPITPTLAASGTSVRFDVAISNPGDSNLTNNTAFAINAVVGGASAAAPGGITGNTLWLKGNTGTNCTTTGCTITTWSNSGTLGAAANAVTGLGTVTYDPVNALNGNATLYFHNASLNTNNALNVTTAAVSIFSVSSLGGGGSFLLGTQSGTANGVSWMTSPTADSLGLFGGVNFYSGANNRSASIPAITTTTRATGGASSGRTNGLQSLSAATPATVFASNSIGIGRRSTTNSTLANVAEVIIYPNEVTGISRNRVESYLAIKYGITLDQTSATDYTLSNSSVVWNATSAGMYKNNIAGIARDDSSGLSQLRSQSVTNTGDIIGWKSSIATNRMALMWAHDGGQISAFTGTDAPTGYQRISREWQFQEQNGDLGTVNISYPATAIPGGFVAPLMLLTNTNTTFVTGSTAYTGTYSTGTNTWDFSLNISNLQYITFAKVINLDTTPPVISNPNIASGTLIPTGTFSYGFSYADTGSVINTGSVDLGIYSWNTGSSTWNVADLAGTYATLTSATSSTGTFQITGLPFGKYRFDQIVSDTSTNQATQSNTLFIDAIIWTISAPLYDIGNSQTNITTFGSGELIITVQTVGAGIDLSMIRTQDLIFGSGTITVWNGTDGWGYDLYNGVSYSGMLTAHGTTQTLANIAKNINQSGQRNTFTYRVKYGVNPNVNILSGDYLGKLQFGLNLTY